MLTWTRLEKWDSDPPRYIELATDGASLWICKGVVQAGKRPATERRVLESAAKAEAALKAELGKLRRRGFGEETTIERDAPTAPTPRIDDPALTHSLRWGSAEGASKKQHFFEQLTAAGIHPLRPFFDQATGAERGGTLGAEARERDADQRADAALAVARRVFGRVLGVTWRQGHDGATTSDVFPSAEAIFERANRKRG